MRTPDSVYNELGCCLVALIVLVFATMLGLDVLASRRVRRIEEHLGLELQEPAEWEDIRDEFNKPRGKVQR